MSNFNEFSRYYVKNLPKSETRKGAYELAEEEFKKQKGKRAYKSYNSFKSIRSRKRRNKK